MPQQLNRIGLAALLVAPAALVGVLGFDAGGYFLEESAFAAFLVLLLLVVRTTLADHPFEGIGWRAAVVIL
nr:hypothetical protein [Actinomycetota bacterium]